MTTGWVDRTAATRVCTRPTAPAPGPDRGAEGVAVRRHRPIDVPRPSGIAIALITPAWAAMLLCTAALDASLWVIQRACFPPCRIPPVPRTYHVVFDRHRLPYLARHERIAAFLCDYVSGVLALARDVAARIEQYWCPIKHERTPRVPHDRSHLFAEYGDAAGFRQRLPVVRRMFDVTSALRGD